ncbi:ATP-grasp domain-containing protein [endosymbiont 'TC1' of Trimyema compressum]|uniref:ATP-grasp domain-containing protein n=1 Tax=endosymbiont 'TC1' of Trimyema compressum TaxID=243899 RepID=UPI000B4D44DE|nr:ATP-grasp domain-containing protein [endosymbiont 'TC1' of Trimyema compressum]
MKALGFYGTLAIEFFIKGKEIYINEMAPRPHNSGHYTIEGCFTSQFERHIRVICGLPLGITDLIAETYMYNLLGQHMDKCLTWLKEMPATSHVHLYGKKESRENRKMGHVTFVKSTEEDRNIFKEKVLKN